MYHPTTRVLTVLELLQAHGRMSGPELARRLEIGERTVRKYIVTLQDLGVPVEAERGRYGAYRLRPGFKLPPLMFSEDEALGVTLGLLAARELGLTGEAAIEGALTKIARVLPERVRDRVQAVEQVLALKLGWAGAAADSAVVLALGASVRDGRRVWLRYRSWRDEETERAFDPYGLVFCSGHWYAAGYCHLRQDIRVFRADRVLAIATREEGFARPDQFDTLAQVERALALTPGVWSVEVLLDTTLEEARGGLPPEIAVLEQTPGGVLVRARVRKQHDLPWMAHLLAGLGCSLRVRKPPELRDELLRLARHTADLATATEEP